MVRVFVTPARGPLHPRSVALRFAREPGFCWLDGGREHGREGRWSFLSTAPCEVMRRSDADPAPLHALSQLERGDAFDVRREGLCSEDVPRWVGYLSYDAYRSAQTAGRKHPRSTLPVLYFARHEAFFAFDHERDCGFWVGDDANACERLEARLAGREVTTTFRVTDLEIADAAQHEQAIASAQRHIYEGDIYQVNLARRLRGRFTGAPLGLYLRMRDESPVPLGMYLDATDHALLGCSMERFLRFRRSDGRLWTSPIKGTLARQGDDSSEASALREDPKEHAEHAMIVDLMRNDLGRVARYGSVEVSELMAVQPFAGLSHLVSTVSADAPSNLDLTALLDATFPPGSVTGTPKERAIEIIEALEPCARGPYTGAYGFIDRRGGCSLAVAIRTAVVAQGWVEYFAGGGIVEASVPARETAETELKAQVFLRAIG
jgi:para-aminobenzoate synthetase component 1